jgi:molecular chaperone HscB
MNYFEFYNIPVHLVIDKTALKRKYHELSRKYHPDFFTLATDAEQEKFLDLSTLNNQAYKTLTDDQLLIPYVLRLANVDDASAKEEMPQEFLMEMMDINEKLMELEFDEDPDLKKQITNEVKMVQSQMESELKASMEKHDESEEKVDLLKEIKSIYLKLKYIYRLQERLKE